MTAATGEDPRPQPVLLAGVEATAQLLSQLCEALARRLRRDGRHRPPPRARPPGARDVRNGVRIVRVRSTAYDRSQLHLRAANYASYLGDTVLDGAPRRAPRPRALHDRPARRRRHRARRRTALRRAAPRHQPGRLPRDRRARQAARAAPRPRRAAKARRAVPQAGGPRRRDRGDDEAAPRAEGRARGPRRGDPELGRHDGALAAAPAERLVARSRASTTRSSSCTPATSATPRTSTRSSARRRSSATSSGCRSW